MSNEFYTILTNAGLAAIANASVSNTTVDFAKIAVGDGNGAYYTPTRDMTALRRQTWIGPVASVQVDESNPNWVNVESVIPATDGGFYIREIGIFNEANVLLAVGKLPETYKPSMESGSTKDLYLKAIFEVTNANVVSLKADPSVVLASKKYVDDKVGIVSGNLRTLQQQVTQYLDKSNANAHKISNITGLIGDKLTLQTVDKSSIVNAINEINSANFKMIRSNKDSEGIYTTVTLKRKINNTIFQTSVLSGGESPLYDTRTVTTFDSDGTTVIKTETFSISYDEDGDVLSEV